MYFRRLSLIIAFILLGSFSVKAEEVPLSALSAIVVERESGMVLYEKNADAQMYPASLTKIMTAVLAIENGDLDEKITVSHSAIDSFDRDGSNMGLLIGEELTLKDLLYGLMVHSAGDAANVIAEHIAGDVAAFSDMMNQKAAEMGASNTHFTNPHGMHDDLHYTTARDMAIISAKALELPFFAELATISRYSMPPTNKYTEERILASHNLLIDRYQPQYYYPGATGIKTGYTSKAGYCLSSAANIGSARVISIVMGCANENGVTMSFTDTKELFSYVEQNYNHRVLSAANVPLAEAPIARAKGANVAPLAAESEVRALLPANADISQIEKKEVLSKNIRAPIAKGEQLGAISYYYQDKKIAEMPLVALAAYEYEPLWFIESSLRFIGRVIAAIWPHLLIALLVLLGIIYLKADGKNKKRGRRAKSKVRRIRM